MEANQLEIGSVYFGLSYEDDDFARPIVNSYEYLGVDVDGQVAEGPMHCFRFIGTDDRLELKEQQISYIILDVQGLNEELKRWAESGRISTNK